MNLFVISAIAKAPLGEVFRAVMPWLWITVLMLLIITYVPAISTFLPSLMVQ
jgi:C4-dicarboxylate transporter, DctM subunit